MNSSFDRFFRVLTVILAIAVVYLFFTMIQALDRLHLSNMKVVALLKNAKLPGAAAPVSAVAAVETADSKGNAANAEYFDKNARIGGELISPLAADAPNFNPLTVNEASASTILGLCSSSLAERDWQNPAVFKPMLAESWEISADHLVYTIKLRRNAMWQEYVCPDSGKTVPAREIVADDFVFAVEAMRNSDVDCASRRSYYKDLETVEARGKYELIVRWKRAYYGSLESTLALTPMQREYYSQNGKFDGKKFNNDHKRNRTIISSGPYLLERWDRDRKIRLRRNPRFFGVALGIAPPVEVREFQIIKHPNTQLQALLGGKLNMMGLSAEQWVRRAGEAKFKDGSISRFRYSGDGYNYIGYNAAVHCFRDRETRLALTLLIDRERILQEVLHGCGKLANGPFAPGSVYADKNLVPHKYDIARAKKLLANAGWKDVDGDGILERDGKKFEFTMLQISGSATQARILPMIKEFFAAAGIDMKLQTVEWSVYIERLTSRNFEACNLGWTGSIDPDPYQIFHSSQINDGDNFVGYKNPEVDRLIVALRGEFDLNKRIAICHQIERHLYNDQPYTFMFYPDQLVALESRYRNVRLFPRGLASLAFWLP